MHSSLSFEIEERKERNVGWVEAGKSVLIKAVPTSMISLIDFIVTTANLVLIGHAGTSEEIAGLGLGVMTANCVSFSISQGLNGAIDTLVSQAYGSKDYKLC